MVAAVMRSATISLAWSSDVGIFGRSASAIA